MFFSLFKKTDHFCHPFFTDEQRFWQRIQKSVVSKEGRIRG
jgi:ribosomal protein L31